MIKAVIEYKDGTKKSFEAENYIKLAEYMEEEIPKGATGYEAKGRDGSTIKSREYRPGRRAV